MATTPPLFGATPEDVAQPTTPNVATQQSPYFAPPGEGFLENLLEKLNPLELLSLPGHAVSEGLGAARAGESIPRIFGAAATGLWRGTDEAVYPTAGEQLFPEDEYEGFGGGVLRLGADIATDPLFLFGGPVFKGAGVLGKKIARPLLEHPAAQRLARFALPTEYIAGRWGGRAGKVAVGKARRALERGEVQIGKYLGDYEDVLKKLDLSGGSNAARRAAAMSAAENKNVVQKVGGVYELVGSTGDEAVDRLAVETARILDDIGAQVEGYADQFGNRFMITNIVKTPQGKFKAVKEPFKRLENYIPQIIKDEVLAGMKLGTKSGFSSAVNRLSQMANIPKSQAEKILRFYAKGPRRAGNIEWARNVRLPDELLERDPAKLIPRYLNSVINRMAFADEFGIEARKLYQLADKMQEAGLEPDVRSEIVDLIRGTPRWSKAGLDEATRKATAFQVISKMGPLSTISNMSQSINTFITEGGSSFMKAVGAAATKDSERIGAIAYNRSLRDSMEQLLGAGHRDTGVSWLAGKWLDFWQFNRVERMNRLLAANAGIASAERMMGALPAGKLSADLTKRGATRTLRDAYDILGRLPTKMDDFDALVEGFLPRAGGKGIHGATELANQAIDDLYRVGLKASNKTQHATKYLDLPPAWRTPEARLFTQYKSFIFQQSKFLAENIIGPAVNQNNFGPLLRAAAAFGIAGPTVSYLRDKYRQGASYVFTGEVPEVEGFDWDDPLASIMEDALYVGAFGIAGDLAQAAVRGDLKGFVLGPTVGDVTDIGERFARMAASGKGPEPGDIAGNIYRYGPFRRAMGAYPTDFASSLQEQPERLWRIFGQ